LMPLLLGWFCLGDRPARMSGESELPPAVVAAGERPLRAAADGEALRVVVLPAFGDITVLRFESQSGRVRLVSKTVCPDILPEEGVDLDPSGLETQCSGCRKPARCVAGAVHTQAARNLSRSEWDSLRSLAVEGFWAAQQRHPGARSGTVLFEDTAWLVEGVQPGRRHFLWEWSPQNPRFCAFVRRAFEVAALDLPAGECGAQ
jgi:hypothetical protein